MRDVTPPGFQQMPQQIQIQVVERVIIDGAIIEVQRAADGGRVLLATLPTGRRYAFPMRAEVAKDVGMKLAAPGIVPPPANGQPPEQS